MFCLPKTAWASDLKETGTPPCVSTNLGRLQIPSERKMKHMNTHRQEYEQMTGTASRVKPVLSGLLLGGLIGAGTALLFAPQSGEKTRSDIQNKTIELRDRTTDSVKDAVSQVKTKTRQVTSGALDKAQELTQHGKDVLTSKLDEVSHAVGSKQKAIQN